MNPTTATTRSLHAEEIAQGRRFDFGRNWARFLRVLDEERIARAVRDLGDMLGADSLAGATFLDAGSGSGLSSLAARRLGATVRSFDFDPASVACTEELRRQFRPDDSAWSIGLGSVLDETFIRGLGTFDIAYSWGVLHHTGRLWQALETLASAVAPGGLLFIAIYNDQGWLSRYWTWVKRLYNRVPPARPVIVLLHAPWCLGARWLVRAATGRLRLERGMSLWHDLLDWLGGYPFEVAKPEEVHEFLHRRGFVLERLRTCGGRNGCNEFVYRRGGQAASRTTT